MGYARFSYADVYVFLSCYGQLECCGCWLRTEENPSIATSFYETEEMLEHLKLHIAAGHNVPEETIEDLKADALVNDKWIDNVFHGMCTSCAGNGVCLVRGPPPPKHADDCWGCKGSGLCKDCEGKGGNKEWQAYSITTKESQ